MKKCINLLAIAVLGVALASCSSPEKMAKDAENVKVACTPKVLEAKAGEVSTRVSVTYPEGYFHPKAILTVTPVIVFEGGECAAQPFVYQGEKVKDNYKVVAKDGGVVTETINFPYIEGMEKSFLELRSVVSYKSKEVNLPTKKVADGVNTTYMLAETDGEVSFKADNYQEVISISEEGQILYSINSADVKSRELSNQSIKAFQAAIDEANANERKTIKSTEVVAYASPDGGEKLNNKLSDNRAKSAEKAWKTVTKGHEADAPEVKSVGQDWEGFQSLVGASTIEDKNLILRVLSMYSDPAVRESEIKNMSEVYTELKGSVLPELRRARFIANVEYTNYSEDELKNLIEENIDVLDEEALLRAATLVDLDKKEAIYKKAVEKFRSDRAQFNLGVVYLQKGNDAAAAASFAGVNTQDADLQNAKGVLAMRKGNLAEAKKAFQAAGTADAKANLGAVAILEGNYAEAVANSTGINKAIAQILTGDLAGASASITCNCARSNYVRAIIAARQGKVAEAKDYLQKASESAEYKARAAKDVEFAAL